MKFRICCTNPECRHVYTLDEDRWAHFSNRHLRCKHCGGDIPVPEHGPERQRTCVICGHGFLLLSGDMAVQCPTCRDAAGRREPASVSSQSTGIPASGSSAGEPARERGDAVGEPPAAESSIEIDLETYITAFARSLNVRKWVACWLTMLAVMAAYYIFVFMPAARTGVMAAPTHMTAGILTFIVFYLVAAGLLGGLVSNMSYAELRSPRRATLSDAMALTIQRFPHYAFVFVVAAVLVIAVGILIVLVVFKIEAVSWAGIVVSIARMVLVTFCLLLLLGLGLLPALITVSGGSIVQAYRWYFTAALGRCPGKLYASCALLYTFCGLLFAPLIAAAFTGVSTELLAETIRSGNTAGASAYFERMTDVQAWAMVLAFFLFLALPLSFLITGATYVSEKLVRQYPLGRAAPRRRGGDGAHAPGRSSSI